MGEVCLKLEKEGLGPGPGESSKRGQDSTW